MKILLITRTALKSETSTGNTVNYLFSWAKKEDLSNVYFRTEMPNMDFCSSYYCIPETELIRYFFKRKNVGFNFVFDSSKDLSVEEEKEKQMYNRFKRKRLFVSLWAREVLWSLTAKKWKKGLIEYIKQVKPDCVYMPIYDCFYMHKILAIIKKAFNIKIVLYSGDDFFSFNRYRLSPFYYINQLFLRKHISRSCKSASSVLCFSEKETEILRKSFGEKVKQINKGFPKSKDARYSFSLPNKGRFFEMLYVGNINYGRINTLLLLASTIKSIDTLRNHFHITFYTQNQLSRKQLDSINKNDCITFGGNLSRDKFSETVAASDILLNIESFKKKDIERVKSSFSTKIVDYLFSSKCILSVGPIEDNSIGFLAKREACLTAVNPSLITKVLASIIGNATLLNEVSKRAFELGKKEFDFEKCSLAIKKAIIDF